MFPQTDCAVPWLVLAVALNVNLVAGAFAAPASSKDKQTPADKDDGTSDADESPVEAAAAALRAVLDGDGERLRERLHAPDEDSRRVADVMVTTAEAVKEVRDATAERFGDEALRSLDFGMPVPEEWVGTNGEPTVDGDTARIPRYEGDEAGLVLKRVDGRWKLSLPDYLKESAETGRSVDEEVEEAEGTARQLRAVATGVRAGKYKSVEDVAAAAVLTPTEGTAEDDAGGDRDEADADQKAKAKQRRDGGSEQSGAQ